MSRNYEEIRAFWQWFKAHRADFDALMDSGAAFWDVALERLQRLDKHLWFELSELDGDSREFVITTGGHSDSFPLVDTVVAHAPEVDGWQFIALKPPQGFDFTTTYEGIEFEPRKMWFLPLESSSRPEELGLRVGVPNLSPAIARQAKDAVAVILSTGLGERSAARDIQHLEVSDVPKVPESQGYIELDELPDYIEWRKRRGRSA